MTSTEHHVDLHWNPQQSQFINTCGQPYGPTEYIDFEGAVRAGKSTPCAAKLARYAVKYPGINLAAARWTQDAIDAQIKPLWHLTAQQRGLALSWNGTEQYDAVLGTGKTPETCSKVYLRGLHASEDSQRYSKLAGLTLAVLWIDQPEEISNDDVDVVRAYVPARLSQVGYPHEVWYTPNPVGNDHWLAKEFPIDEPRPYHHYIHTSIYDNRHVLGEQYILDMEAQHPEGTAFRRRFIDGERGLGFAGEPVYAGYFQKQLRHENQRFPWHVRSLTFDTRFPIFEGWDFGYSHPAVLWTQCINGQWRILAELLGADEGVDSFADRAVDLRGRLFPGAFRFESVCDPSGFARGAGLQSTVVDLFGRKGIFFADYETVKGYNHPTAEYGAIQQTMRLLRGSVGSQPQLVIDSQHCPNFALGMEAGYIWSNRQYASTLGSVRTPDKKRDTEHNHLQDCWLYILMRFGNGSMTVEQANRMHAREESRQIKRAQIDRGETFTWNRNGSRGRAGY